MEVPHARYRHRKGLQNGRRIRWASLIVAGILLTTSAYSGYALTREIPQPERELVVLPGRQASSPDLVWPTKGQAAVGSVKDGVLAQSSQDEEVRPIASMTKVITALALLEKYPYDVATGGASYTLNQTDVAVMTAYQAKQGTVLPIKAGQVITQHEAMQAMLITSANNMSDMLTLRQFGSMDAYLAYANSYLAAKGLSKTKVADASGFSAQSVGVPSEMVRLGKLALENRVIRDIVSVQQLDLGAFGSLRNTNRLLSEDGIIGIKTGTTDEAGNCLLFAAKHRVSETYEVIIIGVVMGSASSADVLTASRALLSSARTQFAPYTVANAGTEVARITTPWGQTASLRLKGDLTVNAWSGTAISLKPVLMPTPSSFAQGTVLGAVEVMGEENLRTEVVSSAGISPPTIWWRLRNLR